MYPAAGLKDQSVRRRRERKERERERETETGERGKTEKETERNGEAEQLAYNKPYGCVRSVLFRSVPFLHAAPVKADP